MTSVFLGTGIAIITALGIAVCYLYYEVYNLRDEVKRLKRRLSRCEDKVDYMPGTYTPPPQQQSATNYELVRLRVAHQTTR